MLAMLFKIIVNLLDMGLLEVSWTWHRKIMHEEPEMPNFGKRGRGKKFMDGMVVAIEPMINMGTHKVKHHSDGWTITTKDNLPSAHFEHNIALIDGKPNLLSTFDYIYESLGITNDEENEFKNK